MNLTPAELSELPVPAAVLAPDDAVIAATPEWPGAIPGAVSFPVRRNRLVVCTSNVDPDCVELLDQLLEYLAATAADLGGTEAMQVRILADSLRLVAGRTAEGLGTMNEALSMAAKALAVRTSLTVEVSPGSEDALAAPAVAALVLVQLAANAERHAGASAVCLRQVGRRLEVAWRAPSMDLGLINATRQRFGRDRWGLGFARIAADALGAALYPLRRDAAGDLVSGVELGLQRLALPLAAVRGGVVVKATRAWDEETGCVPGASTSCDPRLGEVVAAAVSAGGRLTVRNGWWGRANRKGTTVWVAVPPDDILDRARDVLAGVVHERSLWRNVPEPRQSRIFALATLLDHQLGTPLPRVPALTWSRRYSALAPSCGAPPAPPVAATGAIDPRVVVHLAAARGSRFESAGGNLYLHLPPGSHSGSLTRGFERRADGALLLT